MSGGSFNYLYNRLDNGNPIETSTLSILEKMSEWLQQQDQKAASDEIERVYLELLKINSRVYELAQNNDFIQLVKAVEWWCSNDIGVEEFEDEWVKYIARKEVAR